VFGNARIRGLPIPDIPDTDITR